MRVIFWVVIFGCSGLYFNIWSLFVYWLIGYVSWLMSVGF